MFETDGVSLECIRELRCYLLAIVAFCSELFTLKFDLFTAVIFRIMVVSVR